MAVIVSSEAGAGLGAALDALLPLETELPYANFAPVAHRAGAAVALHRRRWCVPCAGPGVLVARSDEGRPLAAMRPEYREFESEHFGIAMARIEPPVAVPDEARRPALRAVYRAAVDALREAGIVHVAARASTRDPVTGWVLQELGGVQPLS